MRITATNYRDKRHSYFMRINVDDYHDPPTESDVIRMAEPLLRLLYYYPDTVTPIILRKIADHFGAKAKNDAKRAAWEQLHKDTPENDG
jgi:hypothetical protein